MCNTCNNSVWMGQPIALEIDHIDGDNQNNARENLEAVCPNCHSLTPTWRGRNISLKRVSDTELSDAIMLHKNIRQALLSVGLTPKGNNYTRANRLKNTLT